MGDPINHPSHYGGKDNPYEAIKVIDAWGLGFSLGNAVKYICRAGKKADHTIEVTNLGDSERQYVQSLRKDQGAITDLKKARWYLDHEIARLEERLT